MKRATLAIAALTGLVLLAAPASAIVGHGLAPGFGFGVSRFAPHDAAVAAAATVPATCLADVRNIDTATSFDVDLRQHTNIDPEDALLAIGWGLTTGYADIDDVLDLKRDFAVSRAIAQDADLLTPNVVSGIALGGGICPTGLHGLGGVGHGVLGFGGIHGGIGGVGLHALGGGYGGFGGCGGVVTACGGLGLGFVSPLDIADLTDTASARQWVKQQNNLEAPTVLAGIALGNVGIPGVYDLGDLGNKKVHVNTDTATSHQIFLDPGEALLDLALI